MASPLCLGGPASKEQCCSRSGVEFLGVEKALLPPLVPSARLSWRGSWALRTPVLYPRPHHQRLRLEFPGCSSACTDMRAHTHRHGHVCSLTNVLCMATHSHICTHIHRCTLIYTDVDIYTQKHTDAYNTQGFVCTHLAIHIHASYCTHIHTHTRSHRASHKYHACAHVHTRAHSPVYSL